MSDKAKNSQKETETICIEYILHKIEFYIKSITCFTKWFYILVTQREYLKSGILWLRYKSLHLAKKKYETSFRLYTYFYSFPNFNQNFIK